MPIAQMPVAQMPIAQMPVAQMPMHKASGRSALHKSALKHMQVWDSLIEPTRIAPLTSQLQPALRQKIQKAPHPESH